MLNCSLLVKLTMSSVHGTDNFYKLKLKKLVAPVGSQTMHPVVLELLA